MKQWRMIAGGMLAVGLCWVQAPASAEMHARRVGYDLAKLPLDGGAWKNAQTLDVALMAQPMAVPQPERLNTPVLHVQVVHDGKWLAFRLRWRDLQASEGLRLGEQSDAVAIQFPARGKELPPVFMGAPQKPVHILHWRASYQRDEEQGKPSMKQLYPNASVDAYPFEFADHGTLGQFADDVRRTYAHAQAAGNPQSFPKTAVDEILAEGFGTSAVMQDRRAIGRGEWNDGEWTVVIARPFKGNESVTTLWPGDEIMTAYAVWQGSEGEVGGRKSLTMTWIPVKIMGRHSGE